MENKEDFLLIWMPVFLIFLCISLPATTHADSESPTGPQKITEETILFEQVPSVYGASKYEQKITEAPSSVTIITAEEIRKYGYRTLAEIIRSVSGFFTTNDRNYSYLGVRGFARPGDYNTRILLLIDGHRLNNPVYEEAVIGTHFIADVDLIERVEVIRGPGSSLYGSNAFFAVINIITRRGRDVKGAEASGETGSFQTYKGRATYGNRFSGSVESIFSGTLSTSEGQKNLFFKEFDTPATNNGMAEHCDDDHFYSLFAKQSFFDFTLEGAFVSRNKKVPTASFGTVFDDPRTHTRDSQAFVDVKYEHTFINNLEVTARVFYDHYAYDGDYVYDRPAAGYPSGTTVPFTVINKDFSRGDSWGSEVQLSKRLLENHHLVAGAEYRDVFHLVQGNYDVQVYLDDRRHSSNYGIYVQDEYSILRNLLLSAGVRYDYFYSFGSTTNPRLALIYNPYEKTYLKLIYGSAFRAPNAYEYYYKDFGFIKSNLNLRPEKIKTYEAIVEQYIGKHLRAKANFFYYRITDLIDQQVDPADGLLVYRNIEKVQTKGLELELEGKWENGVEGRISYTVQEAKDSDTGEILTNSPKHMAKFNLILPIVRDRLFTGLEVQYMSTRKTLSDNFTNDVVITNVTLFSQNFIKKLSLSGSIYNLFNKKFGDPGGVEHVQDIIGQDGRNFRVKLTYLF